MSGMIEGLSEKLILSDKQETQVQSLLIQYGAKLIMIYF